jgi:hypothetical protein
MQHPPHSYPPSPGWGQPPDPEQRPNFPQGQVPTTGWTPSGYGQPHGPRGRPPRRRTGLIVALGAALLVVLVIAVAIVLWPRSNTPVAQSNMNGKPPFDASTPLSPQNIGSVSPDALFWEMYYRQAREPVVHTRHEYFQNPDLAAKRNLISVNDDIFDYQARRYVGTQVEDWRGKVKIVRRCVDSQEYSRNAYNTGWDAPELNRACDSRNFHGDGIIPGGMTDNQASIMITSLNREFNGFFRAGRPDFAAVNGKQYIRLPVQARPLKRQDGNWGMQVLIWSFKETGLDPLSHKFIPGGGPAQGADMVYYIDPNTLLPVFHYRQDTPSLTDDGQPKRHATGINRVEFVHPAAISADPLADTTPGTITWDPPVK